MQRTTIVADEALLERLRTIARQSNVSLAEVIREGLEWRAAQPRKPPEFIGIGRSEGPPDDLARRSGDEDFEPPPWR